MTSSLPVHLDVGTRWSAAVERDVVGCTSRVCLERIEKFLVYPPLGNRIQLSYAAIEAGQIQLALRQTLEKLYEIGRKLEPSLIVESPGVSATGRVRQQAMNSKPALDPPLFWSTFIPLS